MATQHTPVVPTGGDAQAGDAAVQRQWRMTLSVSSVTDAAEQFLSESGFDRGPWLVVAFAAGIASWFAFQDPWQWIAAIGAGLLMVLAGAAVLTDRSVPHLRAASITIGLMFAAGVTVIWLRSELVGAQPYERPSVRVLQGHVLEREDRPAEERTRLTLAVRDAETAQARKVRINVPIGQANADISEGAILRMRVRLMPPAPPMLPGGYDFARAAWFQGLAATGSVIGEVEVIEPAREEGGLAAVQRSLSGHVRSELGGPAGSIAAAFACAIADCCGCDRRPRRYRLHLAYRCRGADGSKLRRRITGAHGARARARCSILAHGGRGGICGFADVAGIAHWS